MNNIFSDNFTVYDRYSIFNQEYLNTQSWMPPSCTSLQDDKYLPNIDESLKSKFNSIFNYRYLIDQDTNKEEYNNFGITHVGNDVQQYHASFYHRSLNFVEKRSWNHYKNVANISKIENCYELYHKMTDSDDVNATSFVGMDYDTSGEEYCFYISDTSYNLQGLITSEKFENINKYCLKNNRYVSGNIGINLNDLTMKFVLNFIYPDLVCNGQIVDKSASNINNLVKIPKQEASLRHLQGMYNYGFLEQSHLEYINSSIITNPFEPFVFNLEMIFDRDYNLTDIIFCNKIYEEFKKINPNQV